MRALDAIGHALAVAGSMTWEITWSLILGFFLTSHPLGAKLWGPLIGPVISVLSFVCSYAVEFTFGALGLIPAERAAKVTEAGITWNYTTILNIIFLLLAAALLIRFFRSGGRPMLTMMGGSPGSPATE